MAREVDYDIKCPICGQKLIVWENEGYGVVRVAQCENCEVRFLFPYYRMWHEIAEMMNKRWSND